MALHGSDNRHLGVLPYGSIMKSGYSLGLGLDQVGIFSRLGRKATKKGLKALNNFSGIDKDNESLSIMVGSKGKSGKYLDKKETLDFKLSDIRKIGIGNPKTKEQKFDYWRVGWDGINDNTSLKFQRGQSTEFSINISGYPITFFNDAPSYTVKVPVIVDNLDSRRVCKELGDLCEPLDCREYTLRIVKALNDFHFPGSIFKMSDLLDIYPIFSKPKKPTKTVKYNHWELSYCGFGDNNELSAVSSQYPDFQVKRDSFTKKFVIVAPDGTKPSPFVKTKASIIKGCTGCPDGYSEVDGGFVYAISIEDNGEDKTSVVSALPNVVENTALKTGQDDGVGYYLAVLKKRLKDEDEVKFVEANPTCKIIFAGNKNSFCENKDEEKIEWTLTGTCEATEDTYRILIPDNCNGNKLEELQERYPDLEIKQKQSQNCVTLFETKVITSTSCTEGCNNNIIEQVFTSTPPERFDINSYWFPYNDEGKGDEVLCGFEIKSKPFVCSPSDCVSDRVPFIMTSTRIDGLSGGYVLDYSLGLNQPEGKWNLLKLERAEDLPNLGGNLKGWEQKGVFYFEDISPSSDPVEREFSGTKSRLNGLEQYSDVYIEIEKSNKAGINNKEYSYIRYHLLIPFGRTSDVESVFKNLAASAGIPFESK